MKNVLLGNWAVAGALLFALVAPLEAQADRNPMERPQGYITVAIGLLDEGFPGTGRDIVLRTSRTWGRATWRPSFSAEYNFEVTVDQLAGRLAIGVVRSALLSKSGLILSGHGDLGPTLPSGVSGALGVALDHPVWGSDLLGVELEYRQRYGFEYDRAEGLLAMFVRWSM